MSQSIVVGPAHIVLLPGMSLVAASAPRNDPFSGLTSEEIQYNLNFLKNIQTAREVQAHKNNDFSRPPSCGSSGPNAVRPRACETRDPRSALCAHGVDPGVEAARADTPVVYYNFRPHCCPTASVIEATSPVRSVEPAAPADVRAWCRSTYGVFPPPRRKLLE